MGKRLQRADFVAAALTEPSWRPRGIALNPVLFPASPEEQKAAYWKRVEAGEDPNSATMRAIWREIRKYELSHG